MKRKNKDGNYEIEVVYIRTEETERKFWREYIRICQEEFWHSADEKVERKFKKHCENSNEDMKNDISK